MVQSGPPAVRLAGLAGAALAAVSIGLGALGGSPLPAPEPSRPLVLRAGAAPAVHVVAPGDTFWSMARRLQPEGDLRPLVDRLVAQHGGAALQPGERLRLPGPGPDGRAGP